MSFSFLSNPNATKDNNEKIAHGKYLVMTYGCAHCHTPKRMTDHGPVKDETLWLSGHNSKAPMPKMSPDIVALGLIASNMDHTARLGPWGISYSANITSDDTGIGLWTLDHFKRSMREGKHKGLENSRMVMPPMPWRDYVHMTDEDVESLYAYLQSTKPVKNVVPAFIPLDKL